MDLVKLVKQLRVSALMSQVYLKPYQSMMVEWLAKYRLSADEEDSFGECECDCVGEVFSKDDFGIQSDLIAKKEIFSMQN